MKDAERLARSVLRLLKRMGASDAVFDYSLSKTHMVRFANNEITVSKVFIEEEVELFVAIKERRAVASTTVVSAPSLKKLAEETFAMAKNAHPSDFYAPLPRGPFKYDKALLKQRVIRPNPEQLVSWVEDAVSAALSSGANRAAGSLIHNEDYRLLLTTGGVDVEAEKERVEISIRAFVDGDASGQFSVASGSVEDFSPEKAGEVAGDTAKMAVNPTSLPPGTYDAIMGPMTFANIIEEVGEAASAFRVDSGSSFLTEKLGQQVASRALTLIDDPTLRGSYGAEPFDDEGLPTRSNTIIENGALKTYLHNSTTAKKFGAENTANAGLIVPSPFNLMVEGGSATLQQLISKIDNGIFVTNVWYLRYQNLRTGDFSTIPRDGTFLIKNGSIERSVKDLRLSDNILRLLQKIEDMTAEKYWIKWWEVDTPVKAPYALIRNVNFTKSTI